MSNNEYEEGFGGLRLWSALALMAGFLIMVFGASLRSQYSYGTGYSNATHIRISPGLILVIGIAVAVLGVLGIVLDLLQRRR